MGLDVFVVVTGLKCVVIKLFTALLSISAAIIKLIMVTSMIAFVIIINTTEFAIVEFRNNGSSIMK